MMREHLLDVALVFAVTTSILWLLLLAAMWIYKPSLETLRESLALLPNLYKLVRQLLTDKRVSRRARWKLWALLAYVASPVDLVPDFVPVIGWADDVIVAIWVLRSALREVDPAELDALWSGSESHLATLRALLRLPGPPEPHDPSAL